MSTMTTTQSEHLVEEWQHLLSNTSTLPSLPLAASCALFNLSQIYSLLPLPLALPLAEPPSGVQFAAYVHGLEDQRLRLQLEIVEGQGLLDQLRKEVESRRVDHPTATTTQDDQLLQQKRTRALPLLQQKQAEYHQRLAALPPSSSSPTQLQNLQTSLSSLHQLETSRAELQTYLASFEGLPPDPTQAERMIERRKEEVRELREKRDGSMLRCA